MEYSMIVPAALIGFALFCFYKILTYSTLRSNTSRRFRYHAYWTSGIRNHEDYEFKGSWFDKRSAKSVVGKSGIGWTRLVDSRTGEVILETSPSPEHRDIVERVNRIADGIR